MELTCRQVNLKFLLTVGRTYVTILLFSVIVTIGNRGVDVDDEAKKFYKLMAEVISAAGHEIRLAILDYLKDGEKCVCDIVEHVDANRSNVSRHLAVLLNSGLVTQRKDGLKMMYSLRTPCILNITKCVSGVLREKAQEASEILSHI